MTNTELLIISGIFISIVIIAFYLESRRQDRIIEKYKKLSEDQQDLISRQEEDFKSISETCQRIVNKSDK